VKTFIACAGIDGREVALAQLRQTVRQRSPDALLFAGGLRTAKHGVGADLLEGFFALLGDLGTFAAVIPGPRDAPLNVFLRAGMNAESQSPGIHLVHAALATNRDCVICGIGGEPTQTVDSFDPVVRCSRTTVEYFLRALHGADQSQKVLLFGVPPTGNLGGASGNSLVGEFIHSYHPKLCVVSGPTENCGVERVAHTTIVNPGRLSDGRAAWIDWNREVNNQVELIHIG
jgi:Icc-related predicted phosphoesterase